MRASDSTGDDNDRDRDVDDDRGMEDGTSNGFKSLIPKSAGLGGLSALSNIGTRRAERERESDDEIAAGRSDSDYYDRSFGRAGAANDRPGRSNSRGPGKASNSGEEDKLRREYELKIAAMQSKINGLEGDVADSAVRKAESGDRIRTLTNELETFKIVSDISFRLGV